MRLWSGIHANSACINSQLPAIRRSEAASDSFNQFDYLAPIRAFLMEACGQDEMIGQRMLVTASEM